jgi:hypothetical protein
MCEDTQLLIVFTKDIWLNLFLIVSCFLQYGQTVLHQMQITLSKKVIPHFLLSKIKKILRKVKLFMDV